MDERSLIRLAQEGDQDAFARLVETHQRLVYSLALQRVGDHHDAEEVAQTAFFKAWRALPRFRGDAAFSTWLYRLTVNAATDLLRQRKRETLSLDDPDLPPLRDPAPGPAELARRRERREALARAVDALPKQARTVLLLRETEGLSYEEIAARTGVPVGTVRSRLSRTRRSLADILRDQGNLWEGFTSEETKTGGKGGTRRGP